MKKLILLGLVIASFWSCSVDDSVNEDFHFEILPIRSVDMPEFVSYNNVYTIDYTYVKPSTCYTYSDLYYVAEGEFRTVAVINRVDTSPNAICEPLNEEIVESSFTFLVENNAGTYIFKFWQGENEDGQDEYLVFEVPIQ